MDTEVSLALFRKERNDAFRSLDAATIKAFSKKWGAPLPTSEEAFWAGIHKARVSCTDMTDEEQEVSRRWLAEHGYRATIGS